MSFDGMPQWHALGGWKNFIHVSTLTCYYIYVLYILM